MHRRKFIQSVAAASVGAGALGWPRVVSGAGAEPARPNVVLIMADDMGFSDIGSYGGEVETPNIDRIAEEGVRFSRFYNAARCCPTRASLLTGLYPHQAGVGHMRADLGIPAYRGHLNDRCVTIAEVLRGAGYRTAMSGKWHLGTAYDQWPNARGFERYSGPLAGASDYFNPPPNKPVIRDNEPYAPKHVGYFESPSKIDEDFYMTDFISDWAVNYAGEFGRAEAPFFLYLAYTAPHWPIQAPEEDIRKYEGRFMEGWDVLRQRRYERLIDSGLVDERWRLPERDPRVPAWDDVEDKKEWDRRMAVYAAMIDRMDQGVGRLLATLEETGQAENTLILFLSDNGGSAEAVGRNSEAVPGGPGSYTAYLRPWAHLSDTPFRLYKHWVHEGGIATPFIAHWPARTHAGLAHTPAHVMDVLPTVLEASGASYPTERQILPPEGRSLVPLLQKNTGGGWVEMSARGKETLRPNEHIEDVPLFWSHTDNHAVLHDGWKLVSAGGTKDWELYDMVEDRTETNDLSGREPEKLRELAAMHEAWADRVGVLPWDEYRDIRQRQRNE